MSNIIDLTLLQKTALRATYHMQRAEQGYAGDAFRIFIDRFTHYSNKHQLTSNQTLANLLEVMSQAQQRSDMLFVADIMQYELIPYLQQLEQEEVRL